MTCAMGGGGGGGGLGAPVERGSARAAIAPPAHPLHLRGAMRPVHVDKLDPVATARRRGKWGST